MFDKGAEKPYYVGITDDLSRRRAEHAGTGRLSPGAKIVPLDKNITYGEARGFEQAYIEHYETKTGVVGEEISRKNRGNKINSYDHANTTRAPARQANFESNFNKKTTALKGVCG